MKSYTELMEGAQEEARRRKQMAKGMLPKGGINPTPTPVSKKSVKPKSTPALGASPDVEAARRRRKARELNATPALKASPGVQKERDKRTMRNQVRKAPSIGPAEKGRQIVKQKQAGLSGKERIGMGMNSHAADAPKTEAGKKAFSQSPPKEQSRKLKPGGDAMRDRLANSKEPITVSPGIQKGYNKFSKFMGNGLKSGVTRRPSKVGASKGSVKGPGTSSHGKGMS